MPFVLNTDQEAWLVDLEITDAPQAPGMLHTAEHGFDNAPGFCCLGRACKVLFPEDEKAVYAVHEIMDEHGDYYEEQDTDTIVHYTWFGDEELAPKELVERLHLNGQSGEFKEKEYFTLTEEDVARMGVSSQVGERRQITSLTELNDGMRWSFKQIAAYIRANPENVFSRGAEENEA